MPLKVSPSCSRLPHLLHAVHAHDAHFLCRSDAVPALWANELSRAARSAFPALRCRCAARCPAPRNPTESCEAVPRDPYFIPPLFQRIRRQLVVVLALRVPAVNARLVAYQQMLLGDLLELSVVVLAPTADLLNPVLTAIEMHHLMNERVQHLLDFHVQRFGGYVHLVGVRVLALPHLADAAMTICSRLALHRDDRRWQLTAPQIKVDRVVHLLQLTDRAAHFRCLFHVSISSLDFRRSLLYPVGAGGFDNPDRQQGRELLLLAVVCFIDRRILYDIAYVAVLRVHPLTPFLPSSVFPHLGRRSHNE